MTVFELALFIAILVAVILLVATILNNASDFHTRTPWFEITLSIKSRVSNFINSQPSPIANPRYRLRHHDKLISLKHHLSVNTIGVLLNFLTLCLIIVIDEELLNDEIKTSISRLNTSPYWNIFWSMFLLFLLCSMPSILLLIKALKMSWAKALLITCIVLFIILTTTFNFYDGLAIFFTCFPLQIFLLSLGSWINYKLEWN